jgi:hypothetical protein
MAEVYVTNRINVHLASTQDNPNGGVVVFVPGLNTVPPVAEADPFVANLIVTSAEEVALAHQAADAQKLIDEHLAEGLAAVQTAEKERLDTKTAAGEAWTAANQAAIDAGMPFSDPHPDPVVQRSITLTSPPHVYAAVSSPPTGAELPAEPPATRNQRAHNEHQRVMPDA